MKSLIIAIFTLFYSYYLYAEEQYNINNDCLSFDVENYMNVFTKNKSAYYKNPFYNKCFALSFSKDDTYFNVNDIKNNEEHIKESFFNFIHGSGLEVVHVKKEHGSDYYDFLKFDKKSRRINLLSFSENIYPSSFFSKHYKEIYFVHEVFHLQKYNFHMSNGEYYKYEVLADIGAIIIISNKYNLSKEITKKLTNNINNFRSKFLDRTIEKDINYDSLYIKFIEDIEKINLSKLSTFNDVNLYLKKY